MPSEFSDLFLLVLEYLLFLFSLKSKVLLEPCNGNLLVNLFSISIKYTSLLFFLFVHSDLIYLQNVKSNLLDDPVNFFIFRAHKFDLGLQVLIHLLQGIVFLYMVPALLFKLLVQLFCLILSRNSLLYHFYL